MMAETCLQDADSALAHIGLRADALPAVQHGRFHAIPQVVYQQRFGLSKARIEAKGKGAGSWKSEASREGFVRTNVRFARCENARGRASAVGMKAQALLLLPPPLLLPRARLLLHVLLPLLPLLLLLLLVPRCARRACVRSHARMRRHGGGEETVAARGQKRETTHMRARARARCRTRAHRWLIIDFSDRGETQNIEDILKVEMLKELSARGVCTPRKEDIVCVRVPRPRNEGETLRKMLNALSPDLPDLITAVIQSNGRFHQKKDLDSPHARLHGVADYEFGIPLGVVVNTTLSRNRVADSLAHKVISKLGGAARWILAEGTLDTYAGRSMIASLPEHALIGGVAVVTPDAYEARRYSFFAHSRHSLKCS